jgi:gas vesicle protein
MKREGPMDDWKSLLGSVAPLVGTALGGPLGGVAASFVADKLGLSDKTVQSVTEALQTTKLDASQVAQLKIAEIEFQKFLKQNDIDLAKLDLENTEGARHMREATGSIFPELLSGFITIGFFSVLGYMMYDHTAMDSQPLLIMLGTLGAAQTAVLNFWLGSNKGSDRTKELLARATLK